ncbi:MAG: acyltransferase family protein [Lentilactobacillus diolivorans]|uniref:acyltransferase family protein n=1 Tax=Lentilactobacillus diolivorans TaxID=179838 RepID=UPI0039EB5DB9
MLINKHLEKTVATLNRPRIEWIDIAKAYGIIAIVLGHVLPGSSVAHFLYWWHIPLFFIIAGIFLEPLTNVDDWHRFYERRIKRDLFSYVSLGILLICLYTVIHHKGTQFLMTHLPDLIIGGRTLNFYTSTFWFVNAYLLTIGVVTILISLTKNRIIQFAVVVSGLLLGASYQQVTWMHINGFAMMPWSMDTVLITAFYTYLGYLLFHVNPRWIERAKAAIPIVMTAAIIIFIHLEGEFNFRLSLKSHLIQSSLPRWVALATVPVILTLAIMVCAYVTSHLPIKFGLSLIGRHTLAIMYGHKILLDCCRLIGIDNPLVKLAVGVIFPVIIVLVGQRVQRLIFVPTY